MDRANSRLDVKRAIMVLIPGVPPPMVDYAMNTPFLASITGGSKPSSSSAKSSSSRKSTSSDDSFGDTFLCKRMDSGNWGERSLANPVERSYHKNMLFADPSKLTFDMS